MRRVCLAALAVLFIGAPARADSQPPITRLKLVLDHPVASNGRMFEGYVYLYFLNDFYFFYPRKVTTDAEYRAAKIDIVPGEKSDFEALSHYKTGDRLRIKARIDVDLPCYTDSTCVPLRKPIFLDGLKVVR